MSHRTSLQLNQERLIVGKSFSQSITRNLLLYGTPAILSGLSPIAEPRPDRGRPCNGTCPRRGIPGELTRVEQFYYTVATASRVPPARREPLAVELNRFVHHAER